MDASKKDASPSSPAVSVHVYCIAGIRTKVHGLEQLPQNVSELACLWLLHPRLATDESMAAMATQSITHWNSIRGTGSKGLIAVSFDQRNHGTRKIDPLANEAWKQGNPRHAQDMYSIYEGTARDTSHLLNHLPSYLPQHLPAPSQHLVLGVSLGAHSAWHCVLHDPRITAAVIIIGCPDFARLMAHRASKSKLKDWTTSKPAGSQFWGSESFPRALIAAVEETDPAGVLLPDAARATGLAPLAKPADSALEVVESDKLRDLLHGKAILNLAGGADKLVPHSCCEVFFEYLNKTGNDARVWFQDRVFDGVGHAVTPAMATEGVEFIGQVLSEKLGVKRSRI
jgi:pimeloyl-ACP methyl ester carboxylesterase